MAGLKEIALRAGVSVSTTSLALNGDSRVAPTTRNRILSIARELDYRPHEIARSLKIRETRTVGFFVNDLAGPFYHDVLAGVRHQLDVAGYDLIVCFRSPRTDYLRGRRLDAGVILDAAIPDQKILEAAAAGLPLVTMDRNLKAAGLSSCVLDNAGGLNQLLDGLGSPPREDLVYVGGPEHSHDAEERLAAMHLRFGKDLRVLGGDFTEDGGHRVARQILGLKLRPKLVVCANDETALGIYRVFTAEKVELGQDIGVTGFDDIQVAEFLHPALTTVQVPRAEWGRQAADILLKMLAHPGWSQTRLVALKPVLRASHGAVLQGGTP
ncbi:MAG: LacI family DNA-binding transcriptional regulator [Spirochaetales bacterium]